MSKEKFDMNINELEQIFNKYNPVELEAFNLIFGYIYDYEIKDVLNVARKVYDKKYKEAFDDFDVFVTTHSFKISDIISKNKLLNNKELKFLYDLTDNALMCLDSIQHFDVEYERISLFKIINSIEKEFDKAKKIEHTSTKVKKLV